MHSETSFKTVALRVVLIVMLTSLPGTPDGCRTTPRVDLTGPHITDIPRNLSETMVYLRISETNINVLNMTVAVDYSTLCQLDVKDSPVSSLITPSPPQTVALNEFLLQSANFHPTPPDLGLVLSRQLVHLSFIHIGIMTIPENHFENYTRLRYLNLNTNPITNLSAGSLAGLRQLTSLILIRTRLNPVPPLYLWVPNLRGLHISYLRLTTLPGTLIENLLRLRALNAINNRISTIPSRGHFVNLQNMKSISLNENPLHCDARLGWLKVIFMTCVKSGIKIQLEQRREAMLQLHLCDQQFHCILRCDLY